MVKLEGWVEIKVLARQGRAIRDIARTVGVSRNTVRKYLRGTNPPHLTRVVRRAHKPDPYKPFLSERLQVAFPLRLPATVLYGELQAQGYDGGMSRLRDYLRSLKPAPIEDPVVRFETAPGHQLQIDWLVLRRREQPFHPTFLDFAHHGGFRLRLCRPYRAKTKGKVERFNRYVRESFDNPLVSRLKQRGLAAGCRDGQLRSAALAAACRESTSPCDDTGAT